MKTYNILVLLAVLALIAGCTQNSTNPAGGASSATGDVMSNTTSPNIVISLVDYPSSASGNFNVTWKVDSDVPATAIHTAAHYDLSSHPGVFGTNIGVPDSGYTWFTQEFASGQFAVPNTFTGEVKVPENATILYLRAHVIVNDQNYWTDEVPINIVPASNATSMNSGNENLSSVQVSLVDYPSSSSGNFNVTWKVDSPIPANADNVSLYYDVFSHNGAFGNDVLPNETAYASSVQASGSGPFSIPNTFTGEVQVSSGVSTYYVRGYASVNGVNYWSDEAAVNINPPSSANMTTSMTNNPTGINESYIIEADDSGFYPNSITVNRSDTVWLTFVSRTTGVYYGGLDFRSAGFSDTGTVPAGSNATVSFVADQPFTFSSFWPSTSVLKATGQVIVQ